MKWQIALAVGVLAAAAVLGVLHRGHPESGRSVPDLSRPASPTSERVPAPALPPPEWAHVSSEQVAEAKRHGVPVAFENDLGMRFVLLPAGTFLMGALRSEVADFRWAIPQADERPRHRVTISQPFYVSIYEVTNGQYRRFRPEHRSGEHEGHDLDGVAQPAVRVSHTDALEFAAWLSREDGRVYRLPTEAEWEYFCRAGTTTRFAWGDALAESQFYANVWDARTKTEFAGLWESFPGDDGHRVSAPVGSYRPNPWGLYDVHGNVWEWCADWREREYTRDPVTDPTGPLTGEYRQKRGGSWNYNPRRGRCADRGGDWPDARQIDTGFRLVSPCRETS